MKAKRELKISRVSASRDGQVVLVGVSLTLAPGAVVALMGPNGSGKSSLVNLLMGHPKYRLTAGEVRLDGQPISDWSVDARSRAGLFLSMQAVPEVPGVSVASFLRAALGAQRGEVVPTGEFMTRLKALLQDLGLPESFAGRGLNEGFSGGERKRLELLQLLLLQPKYALLDEMDAGLDADALRLLATALKKLKADGAGILLVTHSQRILKHVKPDQVILMDGGRVKRRGGQELTKQIEAAGYGSLKNKRHDHQK